MPLLSSISVPSLTPDVLKSLASINVKSVEDVLFGDHANITKLSGLNHEVVPALISDLQKSFTATPTLGSNLYWDYVYNACIIPTGSPGLDSVLDGGLWGGEMTELVGQPATGKTQICMLSALSTAKQNKTVMYIDSANSFSAERLSSMHTDAGASQDTPQQSIDTLLNRIICKKCYDAFSLMDILHDLQTMLSSKDIPFYSALKLVVIDSIGGLLSPILGGKQQQGYSMMASVARLIKDIATQYHIAFLVTNFVVSGGDGSYKPALGMSWLYSPNTQVTLYYDPITSARKAVLTKSAHSKKGITTSFVIDEYGINS